MAKTTPSKEITIRSSAAEYLTFVAATGGIINEHLKKKFTDSELSKKATIRNFRIVQTEGVNEHLEKIFEEKDLSEDSVIRNFLITAAGDIGRELLCLI